LARIYYGRGTLKNAPVESHFRISERVKYTGENIDIYTGREYIVRRGV
jgi:hypothetical protein